MQAIELNPRFHSQQHLEKATINIDKNLSAVTLGQTWFNTESINTNNTEILAQWNRLRLGLQTEQTSNTKQSLHFFSASLSSLINEYRMLAEKKLNLIYLIEFLYLLFLLMSMFFIVYYCKRYISMPINNLIEDLTKSKATQIPPTFHKCDEITLLAQCIEDMSQNLHPSLEEMQDQVKQKTLALEKANKTIEFLFSTSQQLSVVKLSSPILRDALNALAKHAQLKKLCLELNNGHFINSDIGCAAVDENFVRIAIIINSKPYGFLNYVTNINTQDHSSLIESFTGLVARALHQQEHSSQEQKLLLMEERGIIARELHDSIAQSLSFLKIQCAILHRQVTNTQQTDAKQTINNIEIAVADAYKHLRSLLSTFRLNVPESNFKEALQTVVNALQTQTPAKITIQQFSTDFSTDASQHIHLLQIIREAIINAIKHAKCTRIDISCIITAESNVWISVIDNGLGIPDKNKKDSDEHYGLSIMQQRADELGATLTFIPLSKGTEVKLIFPFKKPLFNQGITNG